MIKNFEALKNQLRELSELVDLFKSEAVQLRLVELVLLGNTESPEESDDEPPAKPTRAPGRARRRKGGKGEEKTGQAGATKARGGRLGAQGALNQLIHEKFFANKQTIGAIIEHCKARKARTFKPNELSGVLARFTRDNRLKRDTNKDGQYEYYTT
jgi:hypothetical protein